MVKSTPMMVMTTSNSISVKPAALRLPVMIGDPVQALALRQRVHVEDIIAGLRIGRRTLRAAQAPGIGRRGRGARGERIPRHPPQEIHHHLLFALDVLEPVTPPMQ